MMMSETGKKQSCQNKGFTFIEVMISIAVLSIGLVAVTQTFVSVMKALSSSHNTIKSVLLLEEKMEELEEINRIENGLGEGTMRGTFHNEKRFEWSTTVAATGASDYLRQIQLQVEWKTGKQGGELLVASYLVRMDERPPETEE